MTGPQPTAALHPAKMPQEAMLNGQERLASEPTPVVRARRDRATANAALNPVKMPQEAILNGLKCVELEATPTLGRFRRNRAYGRFTPTLHQRA